MATVDQLLDALSGVTGTGDFHSSGSLPFLFPQLHVEGVGEIALPLSEAQAGQLSRAAEAAPYGHGEETVLDKGVRQCRQIDASRLSFASPEWEKFIGRLLKRVSDDLGVEGEVSAHLYKFLLYDKGGHFKPHRDTEKLAAMFGTLIVALPSEHSGGRLLVRHDGREEAVDFSAPKQRHSLQYAAFFADCEHVVEPVRSGFRCCLVYNLRLDSGEPGLLNLKLSAQARALQDPSLEKLKKDRAGRLTAVLLEHQYTEANFALHNLKGNDVSKAKALLAAAPETGMKAHLGLVTFHQTGQLEGGYNYYPEDPPEDETMGEVFEESFSIGHWRDTRDRSVGIGSYSIEAEDILSRTAIDEGEPGETFAEGYTGNAGCTMDHWYRRAAVILWLEDDDERIRAAYNFSGACELLRATAGMGGKSGKAKFARLLDAIIEHYKESAHRWYSGRRHAEISNFARVIESLAVFGDRNLFDQFVAAVPPSEMIACEAKQWRRVHKAFGVDACTVVAEILQKLDTEECREALFQLLDALWKKRDAAESARRIAARLASLTSKGNNAGIPFPPREPVPPGDLNETRILLASSHLVGDEDTRTAIVTFVKGDESLDAIRKVLAPALLDKSLKPCFRTRSSLVHEALEFAIESIADEVAAPLDPYPDWRRPCPAFDTRYSRVLPELAAFMADPNAERHEFKRPQAERQQIEGAIREHVLDLDCTTIKRSRPYSLICTKNENSYHRACKQRKEDEDLLERLVKLS